jgi:hypothetical protein
MIGMCYLLEYISLTISEQERSKSVIRHTGIYNFFPLRSFFGRLVLYIIYRSPRYGIVSTGDGDFHKNYNERIRRDVKEQENQIIERMRSGRVSRGSRVTVDNDRQRVENARIQRRECVMVWGVRY